MGAFADNMKKLFVGADTSEQDALIARARDNERLAREKQFATLSTAVGEADAQSGKAQRAPRGRRLLLAATGEAGLPSTLG